MDYQRLVTDNLALVDGVVRSIARRHRLSRDEVDELASSVRLKLVENDYQVLRKFEGRSQLRTYLITVVRRHFLDSRNARWGKWRPCAQARRLGPVAVLLDQLTSRDRLTFDEAAQVITARYRDEVSRDQLYETHLQLPSRYSRQFTDKEELEHVHADAPSEDELIDAMENPGLGDRIECALKTVLSRLDDEARFILRLRFCDNVKLARIAELLGVPAKPFYRRVDDLMAGLRRELQQHGISQADVAAILGHSSADLTAVLDPVVAGKIADRPSVQ